jgi:uncharacterized protein YlxW (UPF0749 family)
MGLSPGNKRWVTPLSIGCLLLGAMLTWAYKNELTNRAMGGGRTSAGVDVATQEQGQIREQADEIRELRRKLSELEQAVTTRSRLEKVLGGEIQSLKIFAGLVDVQGPGITVLLRDSPNIPTLAPSEIVERYLVHDTDILAVLNELRAAGAEVIAINGNRVVGRSWVRCVGPVIQLDGQAISSPFRIEAIGDPKTLKAAVNLPGGVLASIRQLDADMVEVIEEEQLRIPAYGGSTKTTHATLAEPEAR